MVARFELLGERQVTPAPRVSSSDGLLVIEAVEPGSSLGYSIDDGPWLLYTDPVSVPEGAAVEAKAVRYGWVESPVVSREF